MHDGDDLLLPFTAAVMFIVVIFRNFLVLLTAWFTSVDMSGGVKDAGCQ